MKHMSVFTSISMNVFSQYRDSDKHHVIMLPPWYVSEWTACRPAKVFLFLFETVNSPLAE